MKKTAAFALIVLAAATLACSWFSDDPATNSDTPPSTANATTNTAANTTTAATRDDPAADINAMADRFLAQRSFRAKMTGKGGKDFRTDLEFVAPDRFRMKTGPGLETVIIGKDVYLSMGDSWQKMPGSLGNSVPDLRAAFDKEGRKWFSDVRFIGEDTVDGVPALVYQYKNRGAGNAGENDSKIWISKTDGLPLKLEATYKSGDLRSMLIEYEYDPTITIKPPVK